VPPGPQTGSGTAEDVPGEADVGGSIELTDDSYLCPYTVVIDSDEKLPYTFLGIRSDARAGGRVLAVPLMRRGLRTGDYSLRGYESRVAVERKSPQDVYGTIGRRRECFQRELARLNEMDFAAVVVEADWETILCNPPEWSRLRPKVVYRSVLAWQQR